MCQLLYSNYQLNQSILTLQQLFDMSNPSCHFLSWFWECRRFHAALGVSRASLTAIHINFGPIFSFYSWSWLLEYFRFERYRSMESCYHKCPIATFGGKWEDTFTSAYSLPPLLSRFSRQISYYHMQYPDSDRQPLQSSCSDFNKGVIPQEHEVLDLH